MSSIVNTDLYNTIDKLESPNIKVEVLEYRNAIGASDYRHAYQLFYAHKTGQNPRQVKMTLNNHEVQLEAGALHFLKGDVSIEIPNTTVGGFLRRAASSMVTEETVIKPKYKGSGEIFLEPSFDHYLLINLENDQLIADRGMFLAADATLEVGAAMQRNLSAAVAGGEGLFQTSVKGTGICVLKSPVPQREILMVELNNETLKVDGPFALLRIGNIEFTAERSTGSLLGSAASGEGLLQVFRGKGQVWLAPTQSIF